MTTKIEEQALTICSLQLTTNAKEGIMEHFASERAFFSLQRAFDVYIEKRPMNKQGNTTYSIYFHNETNEQLAEKLEGKVAIIDCIIKNEGFLATSFRIRGRRERVRTNRRLNIQMRFELNPRVAAQMPVDLYVGLRQLPVAEERSEYVKKRIESWEGYLRIAEKNADIDDFVATLISATANRQGSGLLIRCEGLEGKAWNQLEGMSVQLQEEQEEIGQVVRVQRSKKAFEVQLSRKFQQRLHATAWFPKEGQKLYFSNFAQLSQIRRLRLGFQHLQEGLAANPKLERILFEERPPLRVAKEEPDVTFRNSLNSYQQQAIRGALQAEDLYLIQGPPGTGKTTVIAELCDQLVQQGNRVLIASQSNLAVDNALSRLITDRAVRILRYGRSESIEEEGKRFIAENVALYWRDETIRAVEEELINKDALVRQFEQQLLTGKEQLASCEKKVQELEQQQTEQQRAKKMYEETLEQYTSLEKAIENGQIELAQNQREIEQLAITTDKTNEQLENHRVELTQLQNKHTGFQTTHASMSVAQYEAALQTIQMRHAILEIDHSIRWYTNELDKLHYEVKHWQKVREMIEAERKWDALQKMLVQYRIVKTEQFSIERQQFIQLITQFKANQFSAEYHEWKRLIPKLHETIQRMEPFLQRLGQAIEQIEPMESNQFRTVDEVTSMMEQLNDFLAKNQQHRAEAFSPALQERLRTNLAYLYGKKIEVMEKVQALDERHRKRLIAQFERVKETIFQSLNIQDQQLANAQTERQKSKQDAEREKQRRLHTYQSAYEALPNSLQQVSEQELMQTIASFEENNADLEQLKQQLKQEESTVLIYEQQLQQNRNRRQQLEAQLVGKRDELDRLEGKVAVITEQMSVLKEHVERPIAKRLLDVKQQLQKREANIATVQQQLSELPLHRQLQKQWLDLLQQSTDYDMDEIRKLYVAYANVIGTTCVASARKDFMDDYPEFDVVIVDEVSKATPPELLLPMLKGKKIVLVGDHHQLPPLIGQETMEELLDEHPQLQEQRELKYLLQESLFERLFHQVNEKSKSMLALQYRMHEDIMETITPFYRQGNDELQCGLRNSTVERAHLLETSWLKQSNHALWVNTPATPEFYESKAKNGTSRYNESELAAIRKMVVDLNDSAERAKKNGQLVHDAKKSIGVISFYGEQVKRIEQLLFHELTIPHLHCRTGTVDKFQGMEMDIIIVSFVRNHGEKSGDIGFAKDYRRLNVALSRAKELLAIVGSIDMFTKNVKNEATRTMYERLVKTIEAQQGVRTIEQLLNGREEWIELA